MKKLGLWIFLLAQILTSMCYAQSMVTTKQDTKKSFVLAGSFPDYFPISEVVKERSFPVLNTVFNDAMEQFAEVGNFKVEYSTETDYEKTLINLRQGQTDILLGMYYDTKMYRGLEYIYPAVLNNPVHLIVVAQNQDLISSSEDLLKYKGTYIKTEYFSDYMLKNFKNNNITASDSVMDAYKKLLTGEVDYIIGSYYYNYVKVCELGLKNYVTFSRSALWNMPLFIGVSKASKYYKRISSILKKLAVDDKFTASINNALIAKVKQAEVDAQGVVPPSFVREQKQGELTPADQREQNKEQAVEE